MNTTIRFDTESFVNSLHADDLLLLSFAVEKRLNDLALLFRRENPPLAEERAIQYIKRMRQQGVDKSLVFLKRVYDSPAIEKHLPTTIKIEEHEDEDKLVKESKCLSTVYDHMGYPIPSC